MATITTIFFIAISILWTFLLFNIQAARPQPSPSPSTKNQGLQGGWVIDNDGNLNFPYSYQSQLPLIQEAGAGWIRVNFRLGSCFVDWTHTGCNGSTALEKYDVFINDAKNRGFKILGLLSNESWPGAQVDWVAGNEENTAGNGDNTYLSNFSQNAAVVLTQHFQGKIDTWEVWNEPNAWAQNPAPGIYTGNSFIYPSNFAWLLKHVYEDTKSAGITGVTFVSGGLFAHDIAGSFNTGGQYLTDTYTQGKNNASWETTKQTYGSYPLDIIGQHLYIDQGIKTSAAKINSYLNDVRNAYVEQEEGTTNKKTVITEFGWTTASVNQTVQSQNLQTAYQTFKNAGFVQNAYWFNAQDNPFGDLYFGLQTAGSAQDNYTGVRKKSFATYQKFANF